MQDAADAVEASGGGKKAKPHQEIVVAAVTSIQTISKLQGYEMVADLRPGTGKVYLRCARSKTLQKKQLAKRRKQKKDGVGASTAVPRPNTTTTDYDCGSGSMVTLCLETAITAKITAAGNDCGFQLSWLAPCDVNGAVTSDAPRWLSHAAVPHDLSELAPVRFELSAVCNVANCKFGLQFAIRHKKKTQLPLPPLIHENYPPCPPTGIFGGS